jgi:hypothetical protein
MKLMIGEGRNNFIVEWNENREEDLLDAGLTEEDLTIREDDPIIIDSVFILTNKYLVIYFIQQYLWQPLFSLP